MPLADVTQEQEALEQGIASGEILRMNQLLDAAHELGLRVTNQGINYVGFQTKAGQRFRIWLGYSREGSLLVRQCPVSAAIPVGKVMPAEPPGILIAADAVVAQSAVAAAGIPSNASSAEPCCVVYALCAYAPDNSAACYIGTTKDFSGRITAHLTRRADGVSSSADGFFQWALKKNAVVYAINIAEGFSQGEMLLLSATYFARLAESAGFEVSCGFEVLAKPFKKPEIFPLVWPSFAVFGASKSINGFAASEMASLYFVKE